MNAVTYIAVVGLVVCIVISKEAVLPDCVYAAAGDLDTTFGTGGKVITDFSGGLDRAAKIAIQSDGKIVAAGTVGTNFGLARYNTTGSLDSTFGSGGKVTTDFLGGQDGASGVVIQSDGKIVAAGFAGADFAVARYNTNGSLDTSFGSGGKVITDFAASGDAAFDVTIQSDGKIVAAGAVGTTFGLARYNTNGSLDSTFGTAGKVTTAFTAGIDRVFSVRIQPDGKIVAAGIANGDFALARYNTNGSLDSTFGTGGKVTTDFSGGDAVNAIVIQSDGKIVAAGSAGADFAVARYNTNGSPDTSFGTGGKVTTDFSGATDTAFGLAIQSDGKIVAAGGLNPFLVAGDFALARYNTNGSLDTSFGSGGKVITDFSGGSDTAFDVTIQSDGKIVAAGGVGNDFGLARYEGGTTTPQDALAGLIDQVEAFVSAGALTEDEGANLTRHLDDAIEHIDKTVAVVENGNVVLVPAASCGHLGAFVNTVGAFIKSRRLTSAQGQTLIAAANNIESSLDCEALR